MNTSLPPDRAADTPVGTTDERRRLLEATLGAHYEIIRVLGQGGAGVVYLARERMLERLVAIKLLRSEFVSADSRERFIREARTAAKLMHAHIVPLYSFGQAGETLYYIMGYVEGESLESMLQRVGRCDAEEARRILVEVADALGYAHRMGVVHRDVKPENILIDRDTRRAILTDFGIAKLQSLQSTLTATGMVVGTPLYMSPEQAAGDAVIDGRSDLYSLGVIGYRMLAGRLPIEGSSAQDVLRRHVMQDPEPLSLVVPAAPVDLAWAVMRCLDKDPSGRWPSAEALRQALEVGDASVGELPEALEHLSGRATAAATAAWVMAVITLLIAAADGSAMARVAGTTLTVGALGALYWSYYDARRFGLTRERTWRLVLAPPERLSGWWPTSLRRIGDVWDRLPAWVRRHRAVWSVGIAFLLGVVAPAAGALALAGRDAIAATAALAVLVLLAGLAVRRLALDDLQRRGVPERLRRRWLREPTWNSTFWRRPEVAPFLAAPETTVKSAIDSSGEDPYCVITPTQPELPQGMFDHVDPRSPTPLYAQIASRLRVAIASGELGPGDSLPSVRQLSGKLRINPATVVQAYRELEVEGLVSTRHGAGTFVQEVAPDRKQRDRHQEARRLVREMLSQAGSLGITTAELRSAMDHELKGGGAR